MATHEEPRVRFVCRLMPVLAAAWLALLGACASRPDDSGLAGAAREAAAQPLVDMGLIRPKVPPTLERIIDPYAPPMGPTCGWIAYEIASLDAVLGADASVRIESTGTNQLSMEMVQDAATRAVRDAGSGIMPARGIVRRITGAEAADERVDRAEERGRLRRAYLVGIARTRQCNHAWSSGTPQ